MKCLEKVNPEVNYAPGKMLSVGQPVLLVVNGS